MNPADIFGKLRVVQWNGFDFTLSLIRWGFLRRYRARRGKITFFDTGALFIPKYEIAVYEGAPAVVYSEAPEMVFYYPDKASALVRLGDLESAIAEGGLYGAPMRDFIQDANPQRQHIWVLRASETVIAGRPANAGRAYGAGSEIETSAAKKPMQRFLAFIPRKWRLARWQVLIGAIATVSWWGFLGYSLLAGDLEKDPLLILFIASWPLPAWLVYWLFVIAIRRASANIPLVARALAEIAAFALMIGVAMLVTYIFPERHFWHGEVSRDTAYSPVVFASVLICEVALYIVWKIVNVKQVVGKTASPSPIADPSEARRNSEATEPPDED